MYQWLLKNKLLQFTAVLEVNISKVINSKGNIDVLNPADSTSYLYFKIYLVGYLDKVEPSKITEFERKFMEHVKATQRPLLDQIGKDGHLSEASDAALKKVVTDFMASFQ